MGHSIRHFEFQSTTDDFGEHVSLPAARQRPAATARTTSSTGGPKIVGSPVFCVPPHPKLCPSHLSLLSSLTIEKSCSEGLMRSPVADRCQQTAKYAVESLKKQQQQQQKIFSLSRRRTLQGTPSDSSEESVNSSSLEGSLPFRQSEDQPTGTENEASHSRTDTLQDLLEDLDAGYALFWSGQIQAEQRDAGVAFAIRTDIGGVCPVCRRA
ncbi:unnamed protein product [Schistocephalus solidus]|uniref:Uncharacterized protein n=1 Tax=Schistocephalus solidus TaxID=70667 RepID=A0A183SFE2_SCHSO|nr:unnamed protein product [Schistocephalus solidus]